MTRASFVGGDVTFVNEVQYVPRFQANILHPLVAGDLVSHTPQCFGEFGLQGAALVPRPQILKRVKEGLLYLNDIRIIRIHQRQFLFVHQHAGGDRRREVVALVNQFGQHRYVGALQCVHTIQIPELELRHATALLFRHDVDVNAVVLKYFDKIFTHLGAVVVAITGRIERHLPGGLAYGCRILRLEQGFDALAQGLAMQLG